MEILSVDDTFWAASYNYKVRPVNTVSARMMTNYVKQLSFLSVIIQIIIICSDIQINEGRIMYRVMWYRLKNVKKKQQQTNLDFPWINIWKHKRALRRETVWLMLAS